MPQQGLNLPHQLPKRHRHPMALIQATNPHGRGLGEMTRAPVALAINTNIATGRFSFG